MGNVDLEQPVDKDLTTIIERPLSAMVGFLCMLGRNASVVGGEECNHAMVTGRVELGFFVLELP